MNEELTFEHYQKTNLKRCEAGFLSLDDWTIAEWTNALAGECGEACNLAKKLVRGDFDEPESVDALLDLAEEIADVIGYADLCMSRVHHELEKLGADSSQLAAARTGNAVVAKFNKVSERLVAKGRLPKQHPHQLG